LLVRPGGHIKAGQQIATVGNRGRVIARPGGDGSHPHFEVHVGPGPINPRAWLADHGVTLRETDFARLTANACIDKDPDSTGILAGAS
jgi:murein DD-endopeptidase MepM/ murein hydrolase activator NlpD